jgi:lipopolysaccharide export system permease protein
MQSITRYIFRQLLAAAIAITLALTMAVWLVQSLRWIGYIVNRGLPMSTFLSFVALLLPSFLGIVLPIATFCAVLFVYHKLIMDSELVVLRAAGLSQTELGRPAILLGLLCMLAVFSITLYFLPASYRAFKDLQHSIRNDYSSVLLQEGTFNTIADGITVYVRERTPEGELLGILVYDQRDPKHPVTMMAERGALVRSETGPRVVMVNGNRQERDRGNGRLSLLYFDRYVVELAQLQGTAEARWRGPHERFLPELFRPSPGDPNDQANRTKLLVEGHQRLIAPLYALAFVLVALAALLSGEFNRRGQFRRVLAAILCVGILEALSLALNDLAGRYFETLPAMYAGAIAPILVSLLVLSRRPRRPPATARQPEAGAA